MLKAAVCRSVCIFLIRNLLETTSWKFLISFKTALQKIGKEFVSSSVVYCKPATPMKRGLFEISGRHTFLEHTIHFLTELQNTEVSVTLLKSDSTTDALTDALTAL